MLIYKFNSKFQLHQLCRIRWSLDDESVATLVYAFVTSSIDYCNGLLNGAPKVVTDKLQRGMNSAAFVITNTRKSDHGLSHVWRDILHWLDVPECVTFKLCLFVYKCLHGMRLSYLLEICQPISLLAGRHHLCLAVRGQLAVPHYRLKTVCWRYYLSLACQHGTVSRLTWMITHSTRTLLNVFLNPFCFTCTDNTFSALEISSKW